MPYWRLSGFYFFYFATLGALVPYWGLYLKSIGFTPLDIGMLMALLMISRIIAPVLWAWIADHRAQRMRVVRLAALLTMVSFAGVFFGTGFWWLAAVMMAFSFFWNASLPLIEVITLNHMDGQPGAYGRVRLWGSLGFISSVVLLGMIIDVHGPRWVLPALLLLMLGIWSCTQVLPEAEARVLSEPAGRLRDVIRRPEVLAFLLACFLMQASHGPYYTFYSIYLEAHGYSKTLIGFLWAFAVLCEIGVFLLTRHLLQHIALRSLLLLSFALAALRWVLIGQFPDQLAILVVAQMLHAATFGSFHASAIQMVYGFFTGRHQHRGQAIYGSASFGLGGAVGSFYSGYTWSAIGPSGSFDIAALLAGMAFVVAFLFLRERASPL